MAERLEDFCLVLRLDSGPCVAHGYPHEGVLEDSLDFDPPALRRELDRVGEEVKQGLSDLALVDAGSSTVSGETISLADGVAGFSALGSSTRHIFNLLEPDGSGAISDQVIVLTSDCQDEETGNWTPEVSTIEDGTQQFVGSYTDIRGSIVSIFVTSDVDAAVPAPAPLLLLGAGLTGVAGIVWRRHRRA